MVQLSRDLSVGRLGQEELSAAFSQSASRLSFITEESQTAGLKTRMVTIDAVFRKFPRLVRDVAQSLHKQVELKVRGQETEIDKTMVELIGDPLVHLVRNSLDHGIQMPEARACAGKLRQGTTRPGARQEADQILIIVAHDTAGINPDSYPHQCSALAGATTGGDGGVRLVLDAPGLLAPIEGLVRQEVVQ